MRSSLAGFLVAINTLLSCIPATALAATEPATAPAAIPIADFFASPEFSAALLSPDGRHLAVRMQGANQRERLAVVNLADNSIKVVAQFDDVDIGEVEWVNPERLVYSTRDYQSTPGEMRYAPGLYAVNRDGSAPRQLAERSFVTDMSSSSIYKPLPWHTYLTGQRGAQDSNFIYVESKVWTGTRVVDYTSLLRLDTTTGRSTPVKPPGKVRRWLLDQQGEPRLAITKEGKLETIFYLEPASGLWRQLAQFDAYLGGKDAFTPQGFGPDGTLFVRARLDGDTSNLYEYDLAAGRINPAPVMAIDGYDYSGSLIVQQDKLLGLRYLADKRTTRWFDPQMASLQAGVDAALPHSVNLISVARQAGAPYMVVSSYADVQPATYSILNSKTGQLTAVGASLPKIKPEQMSRQQLVHYAARDGLSIPAWLTVPINSSGKQLPLVVLVHGGPYVRGASWHWDEEVQFLASRGYAVLQPEFRGSTGFGRKHFKAGWKQWGLAMQDDIADGARWAIAQGLADARRICLIGGSYGGYATLMGLVNDPDLYRCGVNYAGVTDIGLMYSGHWSFTSDISDEWKQYGMPELIGDQIRDAAQFKATSPIAQAGRIKQPLLLAYGALDRRVPIYHGKQFHDAIKPHNSQVEWVVYDKEGHGWSQPATQIDFWGRVEQFLGRHIGNNSAAAKME